MKKFIFALFLSVLSFSVQADESSSCKDISYDDSLGIESCIEEKGKTEVAFKLASKVILKRNFEYATAIVANVAGVNISSEGYPDNSQKNRMLFESIKYVISIALFCMFLITSYFYVKGLHSQQTTGKVWSMQNLYILLWLFGGGFIVVYFFFDVAQILAACGLLVFMILWAVIAPVVMDIFAKGDIKTIKSEAELESQYIAAQIIDDLKVLHITDIKNRKAMLAKYAIQPETYGYKLESRELVNCYKNRNVQGETIVSNTFIPHQILNSSYCARTVEGYSTYKIGFVQDKLMEGNSAEIINKIEEMNDRIRLFSSKVERNNCAIAYQSVKNVEIKMIAACTDLEDGGDLSVHTDNYVNVINELPIQDSVLQAQEKALVDELAKSIFNSAIAQADGIPPLKQQSGVSGFFQFLGSASEYQKEYRKEVIKVMNSIYVNNEVEINKGFLKTLIPTFGTDRNDVELGVLNPYKVLDYALNISETDSKIKLFRTINAVSGGAASSFGFNYKDCFNKSNCAVASTNVLGVVSDAATSVLAPAFVVYMGASIWEGVAKSESNKVINTNKQISTSEIRAKLIKGISLVVMITIAVFYLRFNYALYGKQFLKLLDWLFMTIIASFTMLFTIFGFILDAIIRKRIDVNYFEGITRIGVWDILFRPTLLACWLYIMIIVVYIMNAIGSILIRMHLQEYISFYGTTGVIADIVTMMIFSAAYAFLMIISSHKAIEEIDKVLSSENESLFSGLSNSLESAESVFAKIKGLQNAK
ncbi:TPA: hypothetical protein VEP96_004814 [Pseudomonas aeruginosa]|nr:hypothetical protein [Pseudomonas aeruginosa]